MMSIGRQWFQNLSLASKLTALGVIAAAASMVMANGILLVFDGVAEYRNEMSEIGVIATVTGINSTAALAFNDAAAAAEMLGALRANVHITRAEIRLASDRRLAPYDRDPEAPAAAHDAPIRSTATEGAALDWQSGRIGLRQPIALAPQGIIGTLDIEADLQGLQRRLGQHLVDCTQ
jgi:hypothetical protein